MRNVGVRVNIAQRHTGALRIQSHQRARQRHGCGHRATVEDGCGGGGGLRDRKRRCRVKSNQE